jgi:hypothetical protein
MDKLLGKQGKDKITGFVGIITSKCEHLYGCNQYSLNPIVGQDGKTNPIEWFDEGRIEVIGEGVKPEDVQVEENGCENQPHP